MPRYYPSVSLDSVPVPLSEGVRVEIFKMLDSLRDESHRKHQNIGYHFFMVYYATSLGPPPQKKTPYNVR